MKAKARAGARGVAGSREGKGKVHQHGQWLLEKGESSLYKILSTYLEVERLGGVIEEFVLFIPCIRRKINSCLASQT